MAVDQLVSLWFGDAEEQELALEEMYLCVYAAGGGKRNMANFVKRGAGDDAPFHTADVFVHTTENGINLKTASTQLFICRYASGRDEWVKKPIPSWVGQTKLKLVPEWFKARFWDNKQEKKHPWFMFAMVVDLNGVPLTYSSVAFPVHQYYPTGSKRTDPNDAACRALYHRLIKQAPSTAVHFDASDSLYPSSGSVTPRGHFSQESEDDSESCLTSPLASPLDSKSMVFPTSAAVAAKLARYRPPRYQTVDEQSVWSAHSSPRSDASGDAEAMQCDPVQAAASAAPCMLPWTTAATAATTDQATLEENAISALLNMRNEGPLR